jgi:hypothetical protein
MKPMFIIHTIIAKKTKPLVCDAITLHYSKNSLFIQKSTSKLQNALTDVIILFAWTIIHTCMASFPDHIKKLCPSTLTNRLQPLIPTPSHLYHPFHFNKKTQNKKLCPPTLTQPTPTHLYQPFHFNKKTQNKKLCPPTLTQPTPSNMVYLKNS